MSLKASFLLVICALVFELGHGADSPTELYWKSKLGNMTMPKVLKDSLRGVNDGILKLEPKNYGLLEQDYAYFWTTYAHPTLAQVPQDGQVIFFTADNFSKVGTKMKLLFKQIHNGAKFLPLYFTKRMNFASNKLPTILNILSMKPKSGYAKYIEHMLHSCADKGIKDEMRYCATSVEAIVDFFTSNSDLGKSKYMLVSIEEERDTLTEYTIKDAHKLSNDDNNSLVCHKLNNPYVVFLCHNIRNTDVYSASLVDTKGKQMEAIAVCHKDTSDWYSGHLAFQILKLKPGNKPICHFLNGDTIVWLKR